jgi:glyoxylase-like metal-dependent hydrolase (beta-lactamase superfamily II)
LEDGDTVAALGGLQVIHVPGHTPGSIALYQPERQILFCGDMFFHNNAGTRMRIAPGIVSVDKAQTLESARKLTTLSVETLCAGHGAPILTQATERIQELVG